MIVAALALAAQVAGAAQPARDSTPARPAVRRDTLPPDRWLGPDKVQHFFVSGAAYAFAFAGARASGVGRRPALIVAALPTAIIGLAKERRDRRVTGRFSARDLVADGVGAAAYAAILARTTR